MFNQKGNIMNKTELDKITNEMMELFLQNKIEELVKICDNQEEDSVKRLAAHSVLQMHKDSRRLY